MIKTKLLENFKIQLNSAKLYGERLTEMTNYELSSMVQEIKFCLESLEDAYNELCNANVDTSSIEEEYQSACSDLYIAMNAAVSI